MLGRAVRRAGEELGFYYQLEITEAIRKGGSMNRREAIHGLGALAFGATMQSAAWAGSGRQPHPTATQRAAEPLPSEVAGIPRVDSKVERTAPELSRSFSPPYLFNHAARTF